MKKVFCSGLRKFSGLKKEDGKIQLFLTLKSILTNEHLKASVSRLSSLAITIYFYNINLRRLMNSACNIMLWLLDKPN